MTGTYMLRSMSSFPNGYVQKETTGKYTIVFNGSGAVQMLTNLTRGDLVLLERRINQALSEVS